MLVIVINELYSFYSSLTLAVTLLPSRCHDESHHHHHSAEFGLLMGLNASLDVVINMSVMH